MKPFTCSCQQGSIKKYEWPVGYDATEWLEILAVWYGRCLYELSEQRSFFRSAKHAGVGMTGGDFAPVGCWLWP